MTTEHDSTMRKIEALLRLSLKAGTPEEAAAASAKAAELAIKHGIDLSRIDTSGKARLNKELAKATDAKYYQWLASAVSRINACRPMVTRDGTFIFYGRHANAISAKLQFEYLLGAVNRLNKEAVKAQGFGSNRARRKEFRDSFKVGCIQALCRVLNKRYNELRNQGMSDQQANALVVAGYFDQEFHAIDEALGITGKAKTSSFEIKNREAFMSGADAATRINLASQVSAGATQVWIGK